MPTTPMELTGLLLDGRYQIRHVLGAGGFATVYLAVDRRLHDREVAVKVLHPEHLDSEDHVGRFAREIKVAARIGAGCEHLVKISDHGRCGDPPMLYFVMEYLAGPSLRQLLTDPAASALAGHAVQRPLPWPRAVTLTLQLCAALTALHRQGVIHRDIKPENLIIDVSGIGDLLKLLDYGIAGIVPGAAISGDGPRTAAQRVLGTPRYMAPEQLHDGPCDHRIDIYAAGAVLGELLTGEPPRPPGGPPLAAPSKRCPGAAIPAALDDVVLRATAWDPAERFAGAEELSAALIRILRDSAVEAAAEDATTLTSARGIPTTSATARLAPPAPNPPLVARPAPDPAARDRLLLRLGRLAGATFLTSATLGALALVFALFTVVRHARSQAPAPADRLLREDRRAELDELPEFARLDPPKPQANQPRPPTAPLELPTAEPLDLPAAGPDQALDLPSPDLPPPAPLDPANEPPQPSQPDPLDPANEPSQPPQPAPLGPANEPPQPSQPAPLGPANEPPQPSQPAPQPKIEPPPAPAKAPTIEQIVRSAERKIRARCGTRGGDRLVEYTLVFAPGTLRLREVRVEGEHQGRELGDCVEMTARAIDFSGARDRVNELPRALYRM